MNRQASRLGFAESLLFNTVRIVGTGTDGSTSTGTGFFFDFHIDGKSVPVVVTCRHVIKDCATGKLVFTVRGKDDKPSIGETFTLTVEDFESKFVPHPNDDIDLTVLPFAPIAQLAKENGVNLFTVFTDEVSIISTANLEQIDAIDDVVMIGYPNGLWDSHNNLPLARRGITASHPLYDFDGRSEFLIDAACFPGSSGSPVFFYKPGSTLRLKYDARPREGNIAALMGFLYAGPIHRITGRIQEESGAKDVGSFIAELPYHLGFVIKASKLLEFKVVLQALLTGQ